MRRIFLFSLVLGLLPAVSSAQIMRIKVEREPTSWTSLGIGLVDMTSIEDRESASDWKFGQGIQYRVSLEKASRGGSGLGVVATFAQMPLTYERTGTVIGSEPCAAPCDATANIWSLSGGFHMGGGMGLHQVIQLSVGATMFGNFREDATGDALPPSEMDMDLSFNVGYGIGYTMSPRMHASLVQEFGFIMHPGNGSGGSSSAVQSRVMRLGIRYGIGQKRPGV